MSTALAHFVSEQLKELFWDLPIDVKQEYFERFQEIIDEIDKGEIVYGK